MSAISLDIQTVEEAQDMLLYFNDLQKKFELENAALLNKYDRIKETIGKLQEIIDGKPSQAYPFDGSWNDRIRWVLAQRPEGLTARQIVTEIQRAEGTFGDAAEFKRIYTGVSATLSQGTPRKYKIKPKINEGDTNIYQLAE
ncbi:MAG: hypothetical protein J0I32_01355 [Sphingobacteriales bacterium]|nr:hypothetical protein [Sphingobacteriales bacterium]OJW04686.1 MAG: hypothetical protein BGO52_19445 [Sphingobacteriales bacterium 44-61]